MSGDVHVRFREHPRGKFPRVTRRNVYVHSRRAGERVMQLLRRLYGRLHLRINESKSAVASVFTGRKFLGFSFWMAPKGGVKRRSKRPGIYTVQRLHTPKQVPT